MSLPIEGSGSCPMPLGYCGSHFNAAMSLGNVGLPGGESAGDDVL